MCHVFFLLSPPSVMINLEVLADFDFTVTTAGRFEAYEAGLIAPFGRYVP